MVVNPTRASDGSVLGKSCIMHSRRVGFLNAVRAASLNLGLTNSAITPPVAVSCLSYADSLMTNWLMLPG